MKLLEQELLKKCISIANSFNCEDILTKCRSLEPYGSLSKRVAVSTFLRLDVQNINIPLKTIAFELGIDHTTVIHYCNKIEVYNNFPDSFSDSINHIKKEIYKNTKDFNLIIREDAVLQYYKRD